MRLLTYRHRTVPSVGLLVGDRIIDLNRLPSIRRALRGRGGPDRLTDVADIWQVRGLADRLSRMIKPALSRTLRRAPALRLDSVEFLPPVLRPSKVIGVGMNFTTFLDQLGEPVPSDPVLFHKTSSALVGHRGLVLVPPVTTQAVPEGEVAVIIAQQARSVTPEAAMAHIAGLTCANDISARELEFRTSQWTSGKMLDTFCPLGPVVVTPDELGGTQTLEINTKLNGTSVQRGTTRDLVFSIPELVSRISQLVTLEPGDVILTGTPSDLGAQEPPVFLADGDTISVEVVGIGILENRVVSAHMTPGRSTRT